MNSGRLTGLFFPLQLLVVLRFGAACACACASLLAAATSLLVARRNGRPANARLLPLAWTPLSCENHPIAVEVDKHL